MEQFGLSYVVVFIKNKINLKLKSSHFPVNLKLIISDPSSDWGL